MSSTIFDMVDIGGEEMPTACGPPTIKGDKGDGDNTDPEEVARVSIEAVSRNDKNLL